MKKFNITVNGLAYEVEVEEITSEEKPKKKAAASSNPKQHVVKRDNGGVTAPMPGVVTEIHVQVGDEITEDDSVLILEAMKMENEILAGKGGIVKDILVSSGQTVAVGDLLIVIE